MNEDDEIRRTNPLVAALVLALLCLPVWVVIVEAVWR